MANSHNDKSISNPNHCVCYYRGIYAKDVTSGAASSTQNELQN